MATLDIIDVDEDKDFHLEPEVKCCFMDVDAQKFSIL